jgi:hypothetical protein
MATEMWSILLHVNCTLYAALFCPTLDTSGSNSDGAKYKGSPIPTSMALYSYGCTGRYVLCLTVPHSPSGGIRRMPTDREEAQTGI